MEACVGSWMPENGVTLDELREKTPSEDRIFVTALENAFRYAKEAERLRRKVEKVEKGLQEITASALFGLGVTCVENAEGESLSLQEITRIEYRGDRLFDVLRSKGMSPSQAGALMREAQIEIADEEVIFFPGGLCEN